MNSKFPIPTSQEIAAEHSQGEVSIATPPPPPTPTHTHPQTHTQWFSIWPGDPLSCPITACKTTPVHSAYRFTHSSPQAHPVKTFRLSLIGSFTCIYPVAVNIYRLWKIWQKQLRWTDNSYKTHKIYCMNDIIFEKVPGCNETVLASKDFNWKINNQDNLGLGSIFLAFDVFLNHSLFCTKMPVWLITFSLSLY